MICTKCGIRFYKEIDSQPINTLEPTGICNICSLEDRHNNTAVGRIQFNSKNKESSFLIDSPELKYILSRIVFYDDFIIEQQKQIQALQKQIQQLKEDINNG